MKFTLAVGLLSRRMLGTHIYATIIDQNRCVQCRTTAKTELNKCLEAAISQEDKKSCEEKQETHAKNCENECKIEKAAESAIIREGLSTTHRTPREYGVLEAYN